MKLFIGAKAPNFEVNIWWFIIFTVLGANRNYMVEKTD